MDRCTDFHFHPVFVFVSVLSRSFLQNK